MQFKFDDLVGIPFIDGGRTLEGMDCWGLAKECFRRQGIKVRDYNISAMAAEQISSTFSANKPEWVQLPEPKIGCLVLLNIKCSCWANHVGIYIGDGCFLHAYAYTGTCISKLRRWQAHVVGYYAPSYDLKKF